MTKFFIMTDGHLKYVSDELLNDDDFGGFISESTDYLIWEQIKLSDLSNKMISFHSFLKYSKNYSSNLVLHYTKPEGILYFEKYICGLGKKYNFEVKEFFEFISEKNYYFLFERFNDFRKKTLEKKEEWQKLAKKMTDKFSYDSILSFLESVEQKSFKPLSSFVTPHEFECFNKFSKHFSFIPSDQEIYVDVGAYIGDTVTKFIESTPNGSYKSIHAFEPTPKNFQLLNNKRQWIPNLYTYNAAVSDISGNSMFDTCEDSMGARLVNDIKTSAVNNISVKTVTLDEIIDEATLIKLDVEGFENKVLTGAKNLIQTNKPDIIVDTYHFANDAINIYENLMSIHEYKYVSMRFIHANCHVHSLYFSDRQELF